MGQFWFILFIPVILSLAVAGDDHEHGDGRYTAYCTSYCDIYGYYRPPKICYSDEKAVFCCGDENSRFCCLNSNYSIGGRYPDVSSCLNSSWWLYHWRIIIGLLGTLMAVLMVSACCYYCCLAMFRDKAAQRAMRRQNIPAVSADVEPESHPRPQLMFDPESPHAFTPPDYNSLSEKPPDYTEAIQAFANGGYVNDEENGAQSSHFNEPPPSYEEPSGAAGQDALSGVRGEGQLPGATPPPTYST